MAADRTGKWSVYQNCTNHTKLTFILVADQYQRPQQQITAEMADHAEMTVMTA